MDGSVSQSSGGKLATARWADPAFIAARYQFEIGKLWLGRHPHFGDLPIGYLDEKHVLVCAGTRAGKGRSFIINNMAIWPGSLASYDPKGDLATILAPRRGRGDAHCDGMGQDVFVLDPKRAASVDDSYRAYFNPLDALDPAGDDFLIWCDRIANVIVKKTEGTESASWVDKAKTFLSMLIAHVVTGEFFEPSERNLLTVYKLCQEGHYDLAKRLSEKSGKRVDPFHMLLEEIEDNPACKGELTTLARSFRTDKEDQPKLFNSVRSEAASQLAFLKSQAIKRVIAPPTEEGVEGRPLDLHRLKNDPNGVSVFVVLPTEDREEFARWANTVFLCMFAAARTRTRPASGHQTLCVLDEFLDLGKNEYIATALRNIAGAGMKLVIVVQGLGELDGIYKEGADAFYTNTGLKLFFGDTGREGPSYIEKTLGETQIILTARNASQSESKQSSESTAYAHGVSFGSSTSETVSEQWSKSDTETRGKQWSESFGWNKGINWGDSSNWGRSEGQNAGRNYGPHIFFQPLSHATNYGTSLSHSSGGGRTSGGNSGTNASKVRGGQQSSAHTETTGGQSSRTSTQNESRNEQWTKTQGTTEGYTIGGGVTEHIFKKPLLAYAEVGRYLKAIKEADRDHPAYPGLILVMADDELPFFVRRSNYDQDPYFERCFSPDPSEAFIPIAQQKLLGFQYTADHILPIALPAVMVEHGFKGKAEIGPHARFKSGDKLFAFSTATGPTTYIRSEFAGEVLEIAAGEDNEQGKLLTLRIDRPMLAEERDVLEKRCFSAAINSIADQVSRQRQAEAAEKARLAREAAAQRLVEQEREARLAARIAEIEAGYRPNFEVLTYILLGSGGALAILTLIGVVTKFVERGFGSAVWHLIKSGLFCGILLAILFWILDQVGKGIMQSQNADIQRVRQRFHNDPYF